MPLDTDDSDWNEIKCLMREALAKSRGYAEYWGGAIDRRLDEEDVSRVLVKSLVQKSQLAEGTLARFQPDPPDTLLTGEDGSRVGIEVTELVNGDAIAHHRSRKQQGLPISYDWAEWSPVSIARELTRIVGRKDSKLKKVAGEFSQLLLAIMTDEPMIDEVIGEHALTLCHPPVECIDRTFLILSYHPNADESQFPDRCPVFEIQLNRQPKTAEPRTASSDDESPF